MDIQVKRIGKGDNSTLSEITVNGVNHFYFLEDVDRGLHSGMSLAQIAKIKVHGRTAIPTGRYQVTVTPSPRFKRSLPRLLNVPGFAGILIHSGNTHADTEGCLLTGKAYDKRGNDYVIRGGTSRPAFDELFPKIQKALKAGEEIFITITTAYQ